MSEKIPLMLLPGLLCDATLWQAQIDSLADLAAPRVADLTRDESGVAMARRVLDEAPPRFALAGFSMGGFIAQEVMRQAPERVIRLALLDSSARPDSAEQLARRRGLIELAAKGEFKGVTTRLLPLLVHPARLADRALTEAITAMTARVGRDAFLRQQKATLVRPDGRLDLARIACPTLVLCGRDDVLTPPAWSEELAAGIPDATLELIEDSGHMTPMERPEAVSAALRRWLGG